MKNYNDVTSKGGSNYRALTWKYLVFWMCGRLWEVVAYERWSHMGVRLFIQMWLNVCENMK